MGVVAAAGHKLDGRSLSELGVVAKTETREETCRR